MVSELALRRLEIASGKELFDASEKIWVDAHHVLERAVARAFLDHEHVPVTLDDVRLDLAWTTFDVLRQIAFSGKHRAPHLFDTLRTQRIGTTRPAKSREGSLPFAQERGRRPLGLQR